MADENQVKPTVDINGAADMLKVHPKTVLDLIRAGALPAGKVGRSYVLLSKDVLSHVERVIARDTAERMRAPMQRVTTTCSAACQLPSKTRTRRS